MSDLPARDEVATKKPEATAADDGLKDNIVKTGKEHVDKHFDIPRATLKENGGYGLITNRGTCNVAGKHPKAADGDDRANIVDPAKSAEDSEKIELEHAPINHHEHHDDANC